MQTEFGVYLLLLLVTLIFGLVRFKKLTSPFRMLVLLIGYVFFAEMVSRLIVTLKIGTASPIYHFNVIVLVTLTAFIYLKLFNFNVVSRRLILIISVACGSLAILNSLFYQDIYTFPSFGISAHSFQSVFLALLTFKEMINTPSKIPLVKQDLFWINSGTLIFYSFNFVTFVFFNLYAELGAVYWILYLNVISNWVLYSFYLVALYLNQKASNER